VRLWNLEDGRCLSVLEGHSYGVSSVVWSPDGTRALSAGDSVRLWNLEDGRCLRVLKGYSNSVSRVAWSPDGTRALSAGDDHNVRLWDIEDGQCLLVLEGHSERVSSVAWSPDGTRALSGSDDHTVRLWDVEDGRCLRVLEGHSASVRSVAWSPDGTRALSSALNGVLRVWNVSEVEAFTLAGEAGAREEVQVQYTNAKVLLVGDSGVGKTGLARYLALGLKDEERNPSTDGAWATQLKIPHSNQQEGVNREIWLWDFAGQMDYRLVHQLFMDDTAAAVLVFNPQNENPFEGLGQWDRDLQKAARKPFAKLLAAGRVDRGGLVVSGAGIKKLMAERGFRPPLHLTSAKTGEGCMALRDAIVEAIDWNSLPITTSLTLYHRMKEEILRLRDAGTVLIRLSELSQSLELLLGQTFTSDQLRTALGHLEGPGMIQRLEFGGFILLKPEVISRYAAALVRKVRKHPQELGCIFEEDLLAGELDYQDFERLPAEDEAVVLRALHHTVVSRAWCLRQPCDGSILLTFPSYFRRERPQQPAHPRVLVTYRFTGPVEEIYATLVVRLHHTKAFESTELWKDAADFKTQTGAALGLTLIREGEGTSRLDAYFAPDVNEDSQWLFLIYIHNHLQEHAENVKRLRHYSCGKCGEIFSNREKIDKKLAPGGEGKVFCPDCGEEILLRDAMEEKFESPRAREQAREMQEEGQIAIDNESRELILVGHAFAITAEAGQIYRGYTNSDHGIDGEIEFKDDQGHAAGRRLYLQLKSGDSYLSHRQRDDAEVFQVRNPRWSDYWQQHAYPVMLVIRTSDGEIRWMDVSAWLKQNTAGGKQVKQIIFEGERFDALSVRRWRDRVLGSL
jgi:WD40 repeat protein/predicted  nucleic acid-binding Zn-ribbon protein